MAWSRRSTCRAWDRSGILTPRASPGAPSVCPPSRCLPRPSNRRPPVTGAAAVLHLRRPRPARRASVAIQSRIATSTASNPDGRRRRGIETAPAAITRPTTICDRAITAVSVSRSGRCANIANYHLRSTRSHSPPPAENSSGWGKPPGSRPVPLITGYRRALRDHPFRGYLAFRRSAPAKSSKNALDAGFATRLQIFHGQDDPRRAGLRQTRGRTRQDGRRRSPLSAWCGSRDSYFAAIP